jgi:hypothetical protein
MKSMVTWSLKSGQSLHEAVKRFLAGEAAPVQGVKLLGRWHSVDMSIGFSLYETDDMTALYADAARWADVLDLKNYIVIEDGEAGPVLAAMKK